ncbi:MAG: hypothetical protein ACXV5Q_10680 [Frankiaceae bacterium]
MTVAPSGVFDSPLGVEAWDPNLLESPCVSVRGAEAGEVSRAAPACS